MVDAGRVDRGSLSVLIIDDHPLRLAGFTRFLQGLASALGTALEISEAATSETAGQLLGAAQVVVLGVRSMDRASPMLRSLAALMPGVPVVVLSDSDDPADVVSAVAEGAHGFISTRGDPTLVLHALEFVAAGGHVFPPEALMRRPIEPLLRRQSDAEPTEAEPGGALTMRQREVLSLLREGHPNKRIARTLNLREATVKVHVRQIMRRLGAVNRTQAALIACALPQNPPPLPEPVDLKAAEPALAC